MTPWLLILIPAISALVIHFVLRQKFACIAALVGTLATTATLALSVLIATGGLDATATAYQWLRAGDFQAQIGLKFDSLSKGMMLVVTGIGTLVHVFSLIYMKDDKSKARYFGNLSLFMLSMTGIVLADNFVMMFIFWELVGLSSYLLIGHWYEKSSAADAAKKAFLSNRVGDFGFLIGILMTAGITGSIYFDKMANGSFAAVSTCLASTAILLIFCGAVGKSAQFPLHVWLPDAMEGPTPVSALIHAATMVAAGVYMMARFLFSIQLETFATLPAAEIIAWIGGITSLLAALMATQQNDIKKILAYSTLSQLGYMVMAVGLADPNAGMFHLYTHAWFKALLFLGSGAVIYACHHEQDIWKMGGLLKKMPITALTFLIGTLSLTAVPFTSGFFSKEGILHAAHHQHNQPLFWIAVGVAALTTFYMFRLYFVAFLGEAREHGAEEAKEVPLLMWLPLAILAIMAFASPYLSHAIPATGDFHPHLAFEFNFVTYCSLGAFGLGLLLAFVFYFGREKETLSIPLFRNKFYIDELYASLIKWFQDAVATIIHFLDEFIINGMLVGGFTRLFQGAGGIFSKYFQSGNLQHYALLTGAGILLVIYFVVLF